MDENKVIECLCEHLSARGWRIVEHVLAGKRGIDLVSLDPQGCRWHIEAKGGTSTVLGSARFGKPYTKTQVFDVTSKGLMQCFHHVARNKSGIRIAFAYPDGRYFREYIDPIRPLLRAVGVSLFKVMEDSTVEESLI